MRSSPDPQFWAWLAIALRRRRGCSGCLSPILAPFLAAAILAYILNPLVERLTRRRRAAHARGHRWCCCCSCSCSPRFLLIVLPLLYKETRLLLEQLPGFLDWLNGTRRPGSREQFGIDLQLDLETLKQMARDTCRAERGPGEVPAALAAAWAGSRSSAFVANLLLVPVVLFYLLRDWN